MQKILLAGATGYLGGYIADELKKQGYLVRAIARDPQKLKAAHHNIDEITAAEMTKPETLSR